MNEVKSVNSIQTKFTILTVLTILFAMLLPTVMGITLIKNTRTENSKQLLIALCETGQKTLNSYFLSVQRSVDMVSDLLEKDLDNTPIEKLDEHIERSREIFEKAANSASGVLTYYYRIDPSVSDETGYWYTNLDGEGFKEHEVTDINLYDTEDTSSLVWFTVPKFQGKPVWLPSYLTDSLDDVRVVSYNFPIYQNGTFIGVVGIEIDYNTLASNVDGIKVYNDGYAFVNDSEGDIVYHPKVDVLKLADEDKLLVPDGLMSDKSGFVNYVYDGVEKLAAWRPLVNGMRINVTVPVSEIDATWQKLILQVIIVAVIVAAIFVTLTIFITRRITRPLRNLIKAAEQIDEGNYDVKLDYDKNDEIGILSRTFNRLIKHLKDYIDDLNSLAYGDALTHVRNKGAFDLYVRELQGMVDDPEQTPEFAIAVLDCDELKQINDKYGHEKGDVYLKNSSHLICRVFQNSPVFRIGGDEFAVVLQGDDYRNRDELVKYFIEKSAEITSFAKNPWEEIRVAVGVAEYDKRFDPVVADIVKRADNLMYENKRFRKSQPEKK